MIPSLTLYYGIFVLSLALASCSPGPVRVSPSSTNPSQDSPSNGNQTPRIPSSPEAGDTPSALPKDPGEDNTTADPPINEPPSESVILQLLPSAYIEASYLQSFLTSIAGPLAKGRGTGTPENKAVADAIALEFKTLGLKPGGDKDTYFQAFTAKGKATQNIIGILPGDTDEYIVIGAHMDHLGTVNGAIYHGADDNASGTTSLVANARAFGQVGKNLKRGIIFIAFSGEEMGLLGSIYFVRNPSVEIKKIKYMVNTDMIGRYSGEMEVLGTETSVEGNAIARELMGKTSLKAKYLAEVSGGGSDHMPFREIGIPTATFHTGVHPEYHKPNDLVEKIDLASMQIIAGVAGDLAYRLAEVEGITSGSFSLVPIESDGYSDGVHSQGFSGCEPGLVSFEEVQRNLSSLKSVP